MGYLEDRQKELNGNIDMYTIGEEVFDMDNAVCIITDKTINSLEVFRTKKTDKGIDCKDWFYIKDFEKRFSKSKREVKEKTKTDKKINGNKEKTEEKINRFQLIWDKTNGICWLCDKEMTKNSFSIDHKIALSRGGTWDLDNLLGAHKQCNNIKGNKEINSKAEFLELCKELKIEV